MTSSANNFIKGVLSGWAFMIFSLLVGLWMVPFTLKFLSKPEYAIFAIATDLLSWLGLANLGVTSVFNSRGAQLMGSGDKEELNIIASTTFFTQLVSSVIIIAVGIVFAMKPELLFSKDADVENLQAVVAFLVTGFTISYILQPLNSMLVASKQIHIDNYLKFGLLVINTALTVFLLTKGFKLMAIAISNFAGTVIISLITWLRVRKTLGYIKIELGLWRFDRFKFLLKNGMWFTVGGLAGIFILRMDSFLIGQYISLSAVTNFVITIKLYQIADKFHQQFFNTTRPYFAQIYGKGDMDLLSKMHSLSFNLSFTLAFVMGIVVMLVNKWFIGIWVGIDYFLGDTMNMLLCVNFVLQAAVLPNRILLASTFYKIELHNMTRITEGILKLVIAILLIKKFGVNSVVVASIISCILLSSISLNLITSSLILKNFFELTGQLVLTTIIIVLYYLIDSDFTKSILYIFLILVVIGLFLINEKINLRTINGITGFTKLNGNSNSNQYN